MESVAHEDVSFSVKMLRFLKGPVFLILLAGLAIRLVCSPLLTYDFDVYHWGIIMENINSGNQLYELTGYFYTPVWGYIMGFIDMIWNFFLSVDVYGTRVTELFGVENLQYVFHIATITSPEFNVAVKIPMMLCDVAVGYILYRLVKEWTGDEKKSIIALGLWFLSPIVMYMSGVQGMFDTFSALLMLLCTILFWKKYYFLGGAMMASAILLKFFPGFCFFVFVALILVRHKPEGKVIRNLLLAIAGGAVAALIIMMPNILDGTVVDTLMFALGRMDGGDMSLNDLLSYTGIAIAIVSMFFFGHEMYRKGSEDTDRKFFLYTMLSLVGSMFIVTSPQYVIVFLPLLIFYVMTAEKSYWLPLVLISVSAGVYALVLNNYSLLLSSSAFFGFPSADWIISAMQAFETAFDINWMVVISRIVMVFLLAGLVMLFVFYFEDLVTKISPKLGALLRRVKYWRSD